MSDDLPDPHTPVTTVMTLRGILTVTFLRLFSRAPTTSMAWFHVRRDLGMAIC
jgi:hypothetical protein